MTQTTKEEYTDVIVAQKLEAPHEHLSTHKASQSPQQHDSQSDAERARAENPTKGLSSEALTEALVTVPLLKSLQVSENTNLVIPFRCSDLPVIFESPLDLKNSLTYGIKDFHSRVYYPLPNSHTPYNPAHSCLCPFNHSLSNYLRRIYSVLGTVPSQT